MVEVSGAFAVSLKIPMANLSRLNWESMVARIMGTWPGTLWMLHQPDSSLPHQCSESFGTAYGVTYPNTLPFEQNYRCYSASFTDKPYLENGDKVIMPPSALDCLALLHIDYPMLFEIHNAATDRTSHCGVLEFVAEEGMIYMPYWMMQNMLLQEADTVKVRSATLAKGTFVKLQPHTKDFLEISNPKAVLETTLRNFSCLTLGDNIMVAYNNKQYYIDIIESKPAPAISIIETDCEVDFAAPLDYKENKPATAAALPPVIEAEEHKLCAFTGTARRLDGKPARHSSIPAIDSTTKSTTVAAPPAPLNPRITGKVVFGSSNSHTAIPKIATPPDKEVTGKVPNEIPKFKPFTGTKYCLRDGWKSQNKLDSFDHGHQEQNDTKST